MELSAHSTNPLQNDRQDNSSGFRIHLALSSHFNPSKIVIPTEEFLRKAFERYGTVVDVVVKSYSVYGVSTASSESV